MRIKRFDSKDDEMPFANSNGTHLVDDFLRDVVLNIGRDVIVEPPVQPYAVLGLGPQALLNAVVNDTTY